MNANNNLESSVSQLQEKQPSIRERFFNKLKTEHPNLHALYVTTNVILIWSGFILIFDSWAQGTNLMAEPTPEIAIQVPIRHLCLLLLGLAMLLLDDLSLYDLVMMRKTHSEKNLEEMDLREKFFHNFKTQYPNLATIYTLMGVIITWTGLWGLTWDIPVQPLWRSLLTIVIGFLLLYLDDFRLDEI